MLDERTVRKLLAPFGVEPDGEQLARLFTYLELLERWNRKINLTAIRAPEEIVTRHFGESFFLSRVLRLQGKLLDIGSGAGFPGLALKVLQPELGVTLLEPTAKKRAFLKEIARACRMSSVEVRAERLEDFEPSSPLFDTATARAVGRLHTLVPAAARCLRESGRLALWLGRQQSGQLAQIEAPITWDSPVSVPLSEEREIWIGVRK